MSAINRLPKILCIDDESSVLPALVRLLSRDFHVLAAMNAEEGRRILAANPDVAIVLTDERMPGENGLSFAHCSLRMSIFKKSCRPSIVPSFTA